jgi:uncharacterized membrane protein YdjX (TVP38/TMEM64 family)
MTDERANNSRHARSLSAILWWGLAAVVLAAIMAGLAFVPVAQHFKWLLEWVRGLGAWGPVLFVFVYTLVCLLFLPGSVLTLGGGFLFGGLWGAAIASLGATLGAAVAFLLARGILRRRIEHRLATHPKFRSLDRAIGGQGFQIVFLARLCSLFPYDLTSYVFGLTDISFGRYVLATWLGRLPETVMFAYLGSTAKSIADVVAGRVAFGIEQKVFTAVGVAAMVAIVIVVASLARKALREAVDDSSPPRKE